VHRLIMFLVVLAATVIAVVLVAGRHRSNDRAEVAADTVFVFQQVSSGDIDVVVQPEQLDDRGATFTITLDTHATELTADLTQASLVIDDTTWQVAGWNGDEPGGHHREGQLRFAANGRPAGTAVLTLNDLPDPIELTWTLEAGTEGE
jgi:hypothetical protein